MSENRRPQGGGDFWLTLYTADEIVDDWVIADDDAVAFALMLCI